MVSDKVHVCSLVPLLECNLMGRDLVLLSVIFPAAKTVPTWQELNEWILLNEWVSVTQ